MHQYAHISRISVKSSITTRDGGLTFNLGGGAAFEFNIGNKTIDIGALEGTVSSMVTSYDSLATTLASAVDSTTVFMVSLVAAETARANSTGHTINNTIPVTESFLQNEININGLTLYNDSSNLQALLALEMNNETNRAIAVETVLTNSVVNSTSGLNTVIADSVGSISSVVAAAQNAVATNVTAINIIEGVATTAVAASNNAQATSNGAISAAVTAQVGLLLLSCIC